MLSRLTRSKRVLLLDDDAAIQRLVSTLLRRNGFRVDAVDSGSKAIDAIGKDDYDVLLLDLMMPTEGGVTVVKHLRKENPALLERVVLLTGTPESVLKTMQRDVAAIVRKPFKSEELVSTVKRIAKA